MRFEKVSLEQYKEDCMNDVLYSKDYEKLMFLPTGYNNITGESIIDIYDKIKLPERATACSAGYDFFAPYRFNLHPGDTIRLATGIRVLLDDNKFLMCAPRSSHGFKARIQLDNTIGIIDADYSNSDNEGHIHLKLTNDSHTGKTLTVKELTGMMQAIIMQYFITEDDNVDTIRNGGIGSTTIKEDKQ